MKIDILNSDEVANILNFYNLMDVSGDKLVCILLFIMLAILSFGLIRINNKNKTE